MTAPRGAFEPYMTGGANNEYDQALQVVQAFLNILGYPAGIDESDLVLAVLQNGLEFSREQAYNFLFTRIPEAYRQANPNAEFGLDQDTYVSQLNHLRDQYEFYTGNPDIPPDVLRMAIDQGWTPTELLDFLQHDARYSDPSNLPWLSAGQGYRDVKNQFYQTYGKNPTDIKQLASWYQFKAGAQTVAPGQVAAVTPAPGPQKSGQQSEIR